MTAASVPAELLADIARHGEETYPDECCGFLVGTATGEERHVTQIERAANQFDGQRRRRFVIRPEELRRVEEKLEGTCQSVLGFYHSHPDHPARPSAFDRDHAWPWYLYIVLNVAEGHAGPVDAFELEPETREFHAVPFRSAPPPRART